MWIRIPYFHDANFITEVMWLFEMKSDLIEINTILTPYGQRF